MRSLLNTLFIFILLVVVTHLHAEGAEITGVKIEIDRSFHEPISVNIKQAEGGGLYLLTTEKYASGKLGVGGVVSESKFITKADFERLRDGIVKVHVAELFANYPNRVVADGSNWRITITRSGSEVSYTFSSPVGLEASKELVDYAMSVLVFAGLSFNRSELY